MGVPSLVLAVLFALASAFTIAWGTVTRHRIVTSPATYSRTDSVLTRGLTNPAWWLSIFSAFAAYLLQVVALGFGTLLVVQPVLVLSLMFTLMLSAYLGKGSMDRRDATWSALLTAAVIVLIVLGRPVPGAQEPDVGAWWVAVAVGVAVCGVAALVAYRRSPGTISLFMGAVCGIIFGYVAVLSKTVADLYVSGGLPAIFSTWPVYVLVVAAVAGTAAQQYAFAAGPLEWSLPAMKVFEPVVAFLLGYAVLGEQFAVSSVAGMAVMFAALATMFLATVRLASSQA
ncbi:DMT family transporter [Corynebacterium pilosum]|uniref:Hypothetical membrane protein n=1 Tax=Corynebacterium pilosum TaxID=35756 RepID=A0A376CLP3_9CORY|nr:DMT family transporter [Corynebacterium pilosum]STC69416.1 hypothetical membrane protein [Corynebacterium pilosum]